MRYYAAFANYLDNKIDCNIQTIMLTSCLLFYDSYHDTTHTSTPQKEPHPHRSKTMNLEDAKSIGEIIKNLERHEIFSTTMKRNVLKYFSLHDNAGDGVEELQQMGLSLNEINDLRNYLTESMNHWLRTRRSDFLAELKKLGVEDS